MNPITVHEAREILNSVPDENLALNAGITIIHEDGQGKIGVSLEDGYDGKAGPVCIFNIFFAGWCLPESQTVRALLHEIAHAVLHPWPDGRKPEYWDDATRSREVQAEAVAFAVCRHYGLDASDYSIPYIAGWARKLSVPEIEADIGIALRTARDLIAAIDAEIPKRRPDGPD